MGEEDKPKLSEAGDDNSTSASKKTCEGGIMCVDNSNLAVLSHPYDRDLMSPWQSTKLPATNGMSTSIEEQKGWRGVNFFDLGGSFAKLLGPAPFAQVLAERDFEFAHEGPNFLPKSNEVFFVSNRLGDKKTEKQCVKLYAMNIDSGKLRHIETEDPVPQANGATAYKDGIALLAQGQQGLSPGGVIFLDPYTGKWHWLINNWFGLDFNSPNDIVYTPDSGALWFTDPSYASSQGFKAAPKMGEYVWRFVPGAAAPARMVADGFERPNGLALSADHKVMYVTDTGMMSGADEPPRASMPRTIYAFDITEHYGGQFLTNRRVFALADCGIPDGIKLDRDGNVYSGCGDGLNVWAPNGDLIGKICVPGGVSNFCFAGNELILLAETRVLKIHLRCTGNCQ